MSEKAICLGFYFKKINLGGERGIISVFGCDKLFKLDLKFGKIHLGVKMGRFLYINFHTDPDLKFIRLGLADFHFSPLEPLVYLQKCCVVTNYEMSDDLIEFLIQIKTLLHFISPYNLQEISNCLSGVFFCFVFCLRKKVSIK